MEYAEYIEQKRAEVSDARKQKNEEEVNKASSQKKDEKKDEKKTGLILEFYQIIDNSCDIVSDALFGKMENLKNENLKINFITSKKEKMKPKNKSKKKIREKK